PHYTEKDLDDLFHFPSPANTGAGGGDPARADRTKRLEFANQLREFLAVEKPLAIITSGTRNIDGTIFVQAGGATYEKGKHDAVTSLAMSFEHYNRISRLIAQKTPMEIELNVAT